MLKDSRGKVIVTYAPKFLEFNPPNGWLSPEPECHALFYYVILIKQQIEADKNSGHRYEDEFYPFKIGNWYQLFTSIAKLYGVNPEHMNKFWKNIDMQCFLMGSPKLPEKYRFDHIHEIKTTSIIIPEGSTLQ